MALDTYDDLKGEVAAILARSDIQASDPQIDTYIRLCEARINLRLRHRRMRKTVTLTSTGKVAALPSDFLEIFTGANNSGKPQLKYVPQSELVDISNYTGQTRRYSLGVNALGADVINTDSDGGFSFTYYAKIPALSSANTTNWLLTMYPDIYLDGTAYYAFRRLRNQLAADYKGLFEQDIEDLITNSETTTTGGGAMRARISGYAV